MHGQRPIITLKLMTPPPPLPNKTNRQSEEALDAFKCRKKTLTVFFLGTSLQGDLLPDCSIRYVKRLCPLLQQRGGFLKTVYRIYRK